MRILIVPGTTVSVALLPGYVEVRDCGIIKKKIPTRNRSFDEVLADVNSYFKYRGKILAPGIARETLVKIGLPQVKMILSEEKKVTHPTKPPVKDNHADHITSRERTKPLAVEEQTGRVIEPEPLPEKIIEVVEQRASTKTRKIESIDHDEDKRPDDKTSSTIISGIEVQDIEQALSAVESLSDSFMTPSKTENVAKSNVITSTVNTPPEIRINIQGSESVAASERSLATIPTMTEPHSMEQQGDIAYQSEAIPPSSIEEESKPSIPVSTPKHIIKPIIEGKALILGEDDVGKRSLLEKSGFEVKLTEDLSTPYIREKMVEVETHRVKLSVWSFDEASRVNVSRKDFYDDAGVIIVVYSAIDRWSFQSIEFWIKESLIIHDVPPPIVVVANKTDMRSSASSSDEPISKDEGFKVAEELAERFSVDERLHPIAFIETSCETGEGTIDVFKTASELYVRNLSSL